MLVIALLGVTQTPQLVVKCPLCSHTGLMGGTKQLWPCNVRFVPCMGPTEKKSISDQHNLIKSNLLNTSAHGGMGILMVTIFRLGSKA